MESKLFRKKTLERISSPEQLQDYMRVTNPGTWMVLAAVIALLVGLIVASALFRVETTVAARGEVGQGGAAIVMELPLKDRQAVREGMPVKVAGKPAASAMSTRPATRCGSPRPWTPPGRSRRGPTTWRSSRRPSVPSASCWTERG